MINWVLISSGNMPQKYETVLVTRKYDYGQGFEDTELGQWDGCSWQCATISSVEDVYDDDDGPVIAWAKIPEPYKGEKA